MSDYQTVRLLKKNGKVLTIEVTEDTPDVGALSQVLEGGRVRAGSESDAIKLAAILLLDEKGRSGDVSPPSDDEPPSPEDFVASVKVASAEPIGTDVNDRPRFRAILDVTVTKKKYADAFEVDETWGAAADVGGDFDDCFS